MIICPTRKVSSQLREGVKVHPKFEGFGSTRVWTLLPLDGKRWALHNVSQSRYPIVRCKQRRSAGCLDTTSSSASPLPPHTRAKSNFAKVGYAVRDVALLAVVWTGFISLLPSLSRIDCCYYEPGLKLASLFPRGFCALTQTRLTTNLFSFVRIFEFIPRFSLDPKFLNNPIRIVILKAGLVDKDCARRLEANRRMVEFWKDWEKNVETQK